MSAEIIDGKAVAADVRVSVSQAAAALPGQPTLAVILVGKLAARLFLAENCTVTIAHSRTADLAAVFLEADSRSSSWPPA